MSGAQDRRDCVMALMLQTLREDPVGHWQREIPPGWCLFAQAQPGARPVGFRQVCHSVHNQEPLLGFLVLAGRLAPRQLGDKRSFAVQIDLRRVETAAVIVPSSSVGANHRWIQFLDSVLPQADQ